MSGNRFAVVNPKIAGALMGADITHYPVVQPDELRVEGLVEALHGLAGLGKLHHAEELPARSNIAPVKPNAATVELS